MRTLPWIMLPLMVLLITGCAGGGPREGSVKAPPRPTRPPAVPPARNEPINPQIQAAARQTIEQAFASSDPILRANAIEAAQNALGAEAAPLVLEGLDDPEAPVRFAAAMAAGQLRLREAYRPLLRMIQDEPSRRVHVAVRFALHKLGDTTYSHDLEKFARDPDLRMRADVALVLGLLGEKSAIKILRPLASDPSPVVRLQVAEALWRLGNEQGLTVLATGTVSHFADDQIVSVLALAAPQDTRVIEHVRGKLTSEWEEVALAAARAMGILGSDEGYGVALRGAKSSDPRHKVLAALALGAIGRTDAQSPLNALLKDQDPNVRLAAATGVLQLNNPSVTRAQ